MSSIRLCFILLLCLTITSVHANIAEDDHQHVFSPEQEKEFWQEMEFKGLDPSIFFQFPQTDWLECRDYVTGNYINFGCVQRRRISEILKDFIDEHLTQCIDQVLTNSGYPKARDYHLVHIGVFGDPRHSPRSLHSQNRAIDIQSIRLTLESGRQKNLRFSQSQNSWFFNPLRQCWGRAISTYNDCPLFNNQLRLTGSIGKEDPNHQNHLHLSVPYCINKRYAGNYFRR